MEGVVATAGGVGAKFMKGAAAVISVQATASVDLQTSLVAAPLESRLPPSTQIAFWYTSVLCSQRGPKAALAVSSRQALPSLEDQMSDCGV